MYLRGIQFSELESIMQFIYLGEATFYEERMDEFLAVAKSLEIKELCNSEPESNDEEDDNPAPSVPVTSAEEMGEEMVLSDHLVKQAQQEQRREVVGVNDKHECKPCQRIFTNKSGLYHHNRSVHQGVKYACNQCDYQATQQGILTAHIHSKHEGVKYACHQCDYQATKQSHLTRHIQSKHEGVKYACDQCDIQLTDKSSLRAHIKRKHSALNIENLHKDVKDQLDQDTF